jgi:hypothetical protein
MNWTRKRTQNIGGEREAVLKMGSKRGFYERRKEPPMMKHLRDAVETIEEALEVRRASSYYKRHNEIRNRLMQIKEELTEAISWTDDSQED